MRTLTLCFAFAHFSFSFAFCVTKGVNPAYDSWIFLMLAGDVERNPGPVCVVCSSAVREGQFSPLRCADCGVECHRRRECSGLSRGAQAVGRWHCAVCLRRARGEDDVDDDVISNRTDQGVSRVMRRGESAVAGKCDACNRGFRAGPAPLSCSNCENLCHRQFSCSKLHRSQQVRGVWVCSGCAVGNVSPLRPLATLAGAIVGEEVSSRPARGQR